MVTFTQEQQAAINWQTGPMLLNAGAGAGKTAVLIARYQRLVSSGVKPRKILAITFTNKAANEMKERVIKAVPGINKKDMHIFTFHGLCNFWLRHRGHELGLKNYTIIDEDAAESMLWVAARSCPTRPQMTESQLEWENKKNKQDKMYLVKKALSAMDINYGMTIHQASMLPDTQHYSKYCADVITKFKADLNRQNLLSFSDLHNIGIDLFKKCSDIAKSYEYFMVDELQDSNPANIELIKTIVHNNNIVAVGDPKQSIYGFRGSVTSAMTNFAKQYKATEMFLTKNFRSTGAIVDLANNSIKRTEEKMNANTTTRGIIAYVEHRSESEEVAWLVSYLKKVINS